MTMKEKIIIIAIFGLLLYGLTLGPAEANEEYDIIENHDEQVAFMQNAMQTGAQLDPVPYVTYIQMALMTKEPELVKTIGLKFAHCHILWTHAIVQGLYTQEIPKELFAISADRALRVTKMFVYFAGGDPDIVEPALIPGLIRIGIVISAGAIAECTALDGVAMRVFEHAETPEPPIEPEDYIFDS